MAEATEGSFSSVLRILPSSRHAGEGSSATAGSVAATVRASGDCKFAEIELAAEDEPRPQAMEFSLVCPVDDTGYSKPIGEIVENTLLGFHGTVITLGTSSSHTREFFSHTDEGIVARAARQILRCLKRSQKSRSGANLVVLCSYLLVTDETVQDLLRQDEEGDKKIEKRDIGVVMDGKELNSSIHQVKSSSDLAKLLLRGSEALTETLSPVEQATCQTIFTIRVEYAQFGSMAAPVSGTLSLVDLGVMDRLNQADAPKSLMSFVETIKSLTSSRSQQNSSLPSPTLQPCPLTQLLKEALGGNCKTLLLYDFPEKLSTIHYEDNMEALSLVSQSRLIENKPDRTELARKALMNAYMKELRRIHGSASDLKTANLDKKDGLQLAANALVAAAKGSATIEANGEDETDELNLSMTLNRSQPGRSFARSVSNESTKSKRKRITLKRKKVTSEDTTIDTLVAILQDPDKGAPRANITNLQDVKTYRGKGAVFTGATIVTWLVENINGVKDVTDAETLGQILLDKGAIFHSEGSSVFANAESLCYYAREARNVGKLLSLEEIQALLAKTGYSSVTQVPDTSKSQNETAGDDFHQYSRHSSVSSEKSSSMTQSSSGSVWNSSFNSCSLPPTPRSPGTAGVKLPSLGAAGIKLPPLSTQQEFQDNVQGPASLAPPRYNDQALAYNSPTEEIDTSMEYRMTSNQSLSATDGRQDETVQEAPEEEEESTNDEGAPDTAPVQAIPDINTVQSDDQYPHPLHYAAAVGKKAGVLQHLVNWYGVDKLDDHNRTPLMFAALGNKGSVCRTLISAGAVVDHRDNSGLTALHIASYHGSKDVLRVLLHKNGNAAISDKMNHTVLHWAAMQPDPNCLKILFKYCNKHMVEQEDKDGLTPFHWAIFSNRPNHLALLLQWSNGTVNVESRDSSGRTLLTYAIQKSAISCIPVLIQYTPALISLSDSNGLTPLHHVSTRPCLDYIYMILKDKSSLKIDCQDIKGRTPLHYAVLYNNHEAVKLLLINGASPEAQDNEGKTPMDLPHSYNVIVDDDIIEMLESDPATLVEEPPESNAAVLRQKSNGSHSASSGQRNSVQQSTVCTIL